MTFYNFLIIFMLVTLLILTIRFIIWPKKSIPDKLFIEALRNENSGYFEEAVITYETALHEVEKSRFHSNSMRNMIIEKLKVLHTNIEYKNSVLKTNPNK